MRHHQDRRGAGSRRAPRGTGSARSTHRRTSGSGTDRRGDKRRSPLWAKLLVGCGALLFLFSTSAAVATKLINDRVNETFEDRSILGDARAEDTDLDGPMDLLLVGADLRPNATDQLALADTIMILHLNEDLDTGYLVSIPRDLRVEIADCHGYLTSPCTEKINASYGFAGPDPGDSFENLALTIKQNLGVDFTAGGIVDFNGFKDVVRLIGGIELCLDEPLTSIHGDRRTYEAGCQHYNEEEALDIVRQRKQYTDGDYGRQRMQQQFVRNMITAAAEQGYMSNPSKVLDLLDELGDSVVLDRGGHDVIDFALAMRDVDPTKLTSLRLPSEPQNIDGVSYVVIQPGGQEEQAQDLFDAIENDTMEEWIRQNPDHVNEDG